MEDLSNETPDEKLNSNTATPDTPTPLPPLQVLPDPNLETKLMCYNETSGKLEAQKKLSGKIKRISSLLLDTRYSMIIF